MATTSSCLQKKINELNTQIASSKLSSITCSGLDVSYNELLASNNLLKSQLKSSQKSLNDGLETISPNVPTIPVIYIAVSYIIIFFIVGMFYNNILTKSIIELMVGLPDYLTMDNDYSETWNKINNCLNQYRFILFIITFIILFVINVGVIYIFILKGSNVKNAMKVVSISIASIVGVTFILTNNINFVKIFENTIGYSITRLFAPKKNISFHTFINGLFTHRNLKDGINFDFLFSVFRLDNFGNIIKDIGKKNDIDKYDFYFDIESGREEEELNTLAKTVVMKNSIGQICWIIFSSIATTMISIKYLSKNI